MILEVLNDIVKGIFQFVRICISVEGEIYALVLRSQSALIFISWVSLSNLNVGHCLDFETVICSLWLSGLITGKNEEQKWLS